ncbi:hypothetical protein A0J61_01169 [Choanephora cucurbitarum]|uniref:Rhomboid-type serine protease n=1 Tax=Choanephora cucurbitarum TaxID=101091 RepID=A0A1C7NP85_9FUNG|nr:hypothetical protein A0J61_01169 [Choanephora cucurbitarum]
MAGSIKEDSTKENTTHFAEDGFTSPITAHTPLPSDDKPTSPLDDKSSLASPRENQGKLEIDSTNYGPTFKEELGNHYDPSAVPATSALLTSGFAPPSSDEKSVPYHEASSVPPPPLHTEQRRVDTFVQRMKGYQQPNDLEGQFKAFPRSAPNDNRSFKGLLYRQICGGSRFATFTYTTAIIMIGVFIYELVRNNQLTGSVIQTSPSFNPMIGPNYMVLINMGSRFNPCMRTMSSWTPTTAVSNCYTSDSTCTVESLCGFGGFNGVTPNQTFRFFTSIFLHGGVVHILMNMITHFSLGSDVERTLGTPRYALLYLGSGVFGFVLSALLAGPTVSSMGCSGALFGIVGFTVIDLLFRWRQTRRPGRELCQLVFVVVISLVLGLLPGLDNFAHIGGLVMGLLIGTLISTVRSESSPRAKILAWSSKLVSLVLIVVLFIVCLRAFYNTSDLSTVCPNCKYLSCLPVNGWCDV